MKSTTIRINGMNNLQKAMKRVKPHIAEMVRRAIAETELAIGHPVTVAVFGKGVLDSPTGRSKASKGPVR